MESHTRKQKIIVTVLGILFLIATIAVGVFVNRYVTKTRIGAANPSISLTSNTSSPKVNTSFIVAATMNTQGMSVTGIDLSIKYDPNKFTATSITPGSFLPYVFIPGTITNDVANIVLGPPIDSSGPHPVSGSGLVAQITFTAKTVGTSIITIDSSTKVSVSGQSSNMVGLLTPITITVAASPSPVPTKSPSPKPTPTNSPSPTPTRSPSPTPTRSPSPTPSPTPTPLPTTAPISGDANKDGRVNIVDIGIIIDNYSITPLPDIRADLNGDGIANIIDIGIVIDNYGG